MATVNPFDLLGDDDNDDPSQLIAAAQQQKIAAAAVTASAVRKKSPAAAASAPATAKMPTKPVPPSQAVRESKNSTNAPPRGGAGRGGPGRGRGGRGAGFGPNRDFGDGDANGFSGGYGGNGGGIAEERDGNKPSERSRGGYGGPPRQSFRGGRRGGYGNGDGEAGDETEHPPRRAYERRSGTGRGYEMKREGAGRGNWGTVTDEVVGAQETVENVNPDEKIAIPEKQPDQEDGKPVEGDKDVKDNAVNEEEEKPEDKEMTLDEYEKIKEEKRKALLAMKSEERKVSIDKELESMQQLSLKKGNDDIFIKLGSDKESKRRENADREERVKKALSINEFLKPAEGERYYSPGGRGRGRGRGDRGSFRGGFGGGPINTPAPKIEDPGQFPTLGGK